MSTQSRARPRDATRRILVLADETCAGRALFDEIRERARPGESEVVVVAPALTGKLRYWLSDEDAGIRAAHERLDASVARLGAAGIVARGEVGDADPLQALDDAVRVHAPDEIVIATHPPQRSNWLEAGLVDQARARFGLPITHVVVDLEHESAEVVAREAPARRAPARERHRARDVFLLALALVFALFGTVASVLLAGTDIATWAMVTWVIVMDLGLKVFLAVVLWELFQRRPRADRLDF